MKKIRRWLTTCCLTMVFAGGAWGAETPWRFGMETAWLWDDNVGRSQNEADIKEDVFFSGRVNGGYTWEPSRSSALTLSGFGRVEEFRDYVGLSSTQYGLLLDYRFQTRPGFTAPRYSIFLRGTELDSETDIRDSTRWDLGVRITRRLTTVLTGTIGVTASERAARGRVFDLKKTRYFVNADYSLGQKTALYATYNFIDGDVFSTATPTLAIINWAEAIEPDNAFGGIANNKFVYRLDANTQILRLGLNIGLGHSSAIDISADKLRADGAGPIYYERTAAAVSFLYRF